MIFAKNPIFERTVRHCLMESRMMLIVIKRGMLAQQWRNSWHGIIYDESMGGRKKVEKKWKNDQKKEKKMEKNETTRKKVENYKISRKTVQKYIKSTLIYFFRPTCSMLTCSYVH